MSEPSMRKTQARIAERERRRKQEEGKYRLLKIILVAVVSIVAVAGIGYAVLPSIIKPPRPANPAIVGPRLQVDREQMDLGNRPLNVPVRAQFSVKNVGDDTLNLVVPQVVTALEGC